MNQKQKIFIKIIVSIIILHCTIFSYHFAYASSINKKVLGKFLNQERKVHNLNELNWDYKLYQAASNKANHMLKNDYFEHYAPDGTSPWDFIDESNYTYKIAGENLAIDFLTSEAIHDAWMNSELHKENILNPKYNDYAIAIQEGIIDGEQTSVIVEMFGTKDNSFVSKTNNLISMMLNYLLGTKDNFI